RYLNNGLSGEIMKIDFAANAESLGARAILARTYEDLGKAIETCRQECATCVVVVETDYHHRVPGYLSWWDAPMSEASDAESVQPSYQNYTSSRQNERCFTGLPSSPAPSDKERVTSN